MARKKKNNNNQTTSAAPNKEQAQKQSQEESRVIDELFGNLDEPDIESDSAGGANKIAAALVGFLAGFEKLDSASLAAFAE